MTKHHYLCRKADMLLHMNKDPLAIHVEAGRTTTL